MEVPGEADDFFATRECARVPHGKHGGLGAAHGEPHPLGAGNQALNLLGPGNFHLVACAVMRTLVALLGDRGDDARMVVAEQQCAVAHPVVEQLVTIDIPLATAFGPLDVDGKRSEIAAIVSNAARDHVARALVKLRRFRKALAECIFNRRRSRYSHTRSVESGPVQSRDASASPSRSVRISGPLAMIATVCSKWQLRLPSTVTAVQPSSSMRTSAEPRFT